MPQAGTVYRYVRLDVDHDVSADTLELSVDQVTWVSTGVVYIATGARPASVIAADTAHPPASGFAGYWWRVLTGPGTAFTTLYNGVTVYGRLTDTPETPHFAWKVTVDPGT